jgi:hypothetical protein
MKRRRPCGAVTACHGDVVCSGPDSEDRQGHGEDCEGHRMGDCHEDGQCGCLDE